MNIVLCDDFCSYHRKAINLSPDSAAVLEITLKLNQWSVQMQSKTYPYRTAFQVTSVFLCH
uniref:Uncharacterized protein n=1 Tax=Anguilla anguilla TaxID=7936 RepID=A0A0E9XAU2_ANGAN